MKDDVEFLRLWDMYSPLLTATQKEITDLYFNYDLSLGEIAEQKGVSRQSVSDCLQKSRKQLLEYEKKLSFLKALEETTREYSAYMTTVTRWIQAQREKGGADKEALNALENELEAAHQQFGAEISDVEGGVIVGKAFRESGN